MHEKLSKNLQNFALDFGVEILNFLSMIALGFKF